MFFFFYETASFSITGYKRKLALQLNTVPQQWSAVLCSNTGGTTPLALNAVILRYI